MPVQQSFIEGGDAFIPQDTASRNIRERVFEILKRFPEARNDYMALIVRYWFTYDGLDMVIQTQALQDKFMRWFTGRATSPKTIQNRAMEVQNELPHLDADPEVEARRQQQARQGPVT